MGSIPPEQVLFIEAQFVHQTNVSVAFTNVRAIKRCNIYLVPIHESSSGNLIGLALWEVSPGRYKIGRVVSLVE